MIPSEEQRNTLKLWLDGAWFANSLAVDAYNTTGTYSMNELESLAWASTRRKRRARDKTTGELI